jgi:NADH-quinone oxidoreductase subunit J
MGAALFVELSIAVLGSSLIALGTHGPDVNPSFGNPAAIGRLLLERFLLAFEASSILLLLAAVGAVVLAGRNRTSELKDEASPSSEHSAPKARSEEGLASSPPTQGVPS